MTPYTEQDRALLFELGRAFEFGLPTEDEARRVEEAYHRALVPEAAPRPTAGNGVATCNCGRCFFGADALSQLATHIASEHPLSTNTTAARRPTEATAEYCPWCGFAVAGHEAAVEAGACPLVRDAVLAEKERAEASLAAVTRERNALRDMVVPQPGEREAARLLLAACKDAVGVLARMPAWGEADKAADDAIRGAIKAYEAAAVAAALAGTKETNRE